MKILFLTFYFEPDLCAGSFRNSSLFKELTPLLTRDDEIEVITTHPNRYDSYKVDAKSFENLEERITVNRIKLPLHGNGILGQIKSFKKFYFEALKLVKNKEYDLVYSSSSRLFSAFLGARIAKKKNAKLYLDIRDVFRETILDLYTNPLIQLLLNIALRPIENYTFNKANHINLVSEGFRSYFDKYKTNYSYFTNGIDAVFLNIKSDDIINQESPELRTILYGGNIGEGQGLHLIVPKVAEKVKGKFKFLIIGDGGAKSKLIAEINKRNLDNVILLPPVSRNELIAHYHKADYLFLHLNMHKAFERVLPSKLFEYGTFNKPVIAGVGGYANVFLKKNMVNTILFEPTNADELYDKLISFKYKKVNRVDFKQKFSRKKINAKMAKSIINVLNG